MRKSNVTQNASRIVIVVFVAVCGLLLSACSNATSTNASQQALKSQQQPAEFNPQKPVPDQYLKDFLAFMDDYNKQLHKRIDGGGHVDRQEWATFIGKQNTDGNYRFRNVSYKRDANLETADHALLREDVGKAWSSLVVLSMMYDIQLQNHQNQVEVHKAEIKFKSAYDHATRELK